MDHLVDGVQTGENGSEVRPPKMFNRPLSHTPDDHDLTIGDGRCHCAMPPFVCFIILVSVAVFGSGLSE